MQSSKKLCAPLPEAEACREQHFCYKGENKRKAVLSLTGQCRKVGAKVGAKMVLYTILLAETEGAVFQCEAKCKLNRICGFLSTKKVT